MNVTVNNKTLSLLVNDLKSNDDIIEFLNSVIDEEFEKGTPDCDLINDCIDAIASLEDDDSKKPVLHIALTPQTIKKIVNPHRSSWNNLNRALRVAIIAAIIATGTVSVNAAVNSVTGVNLIKELASAVVEVFTSSDDEKNKQIKTEKPIKSKKQSNTASEGSNVQIAEDVEKNESAASTSDDTSIDNKIIDDSPQVVSNSSYNKTDVKTDDKPLITRPSVSYAPSVDNGKDPEKNDNNKDNNDIPSKTFKGVEAQYASMKRNLVIGETLDYTGMTVYAVYSDGSKEQISLSDCTYQKAFDTSKVGDYTLQVQYKSAVFNFGVTVRPDEETRYSSICSNYEFDYLLADKGAYITKYKGSSDVLTLDSVDGNNVYALSPKLFESGSIKEISSSTVTKLYDSVFKNCKSLERVNMPNCNVIGSEAFNGCENLFDYTLADTLSSIGNGSFAKSGIESVTLGSKITNIPEFAFSECSALIEVNMLGKVTKIGNNAFSECSSLMNVNGTAYISSVGDFGFYSCENMEFDAQPTRLHSVGNCGFAMCKTVDLGELYGLVSIGVQAFQYCSNIDSVCISGDVTTIPNAAFQGVHIKELVIEEGVEVIEPYAFMSTLVKEIELPRSVTEIGTYSFYTTALTAVKGGENVQTVGSRAFYPSRRLTIYADSENALVRFARDNNIKFIVGNRGEEQEI